MQQRLPIWALETPRQFTFLLGASSKNVDCWEGSKNMVSLRTGLGNPGLEPRYMALSVHVMVSALAGMLSAY